MLIVNYPKCRVCGVVVSTHGTFNSQEDVDNMRCDECHLESVPYDNCEHCGEMVHDDEAIDLDGTRLCRNCAGITCSCDDDESQFVQNHGMCEACFFL